VTIKLLVKVENYQTLYDKLVDVSNGAISVTKSEEKFMDFNTV
jgi:hypothetical protein